MWNPFGSKRVAPPTVSSDTIIPLGILDDTPVYRAIVIRLMFRFDDVLDAEKLRRSLEKLIDREGWCKLGARLRLNSNNKLEYHIPRAFNEERPSLLYANVKHEMRIAEHKVASKLPRASSVPAVVANSDELVSLHDVPGFPTTIEDYIYSDLPQLGLHIISFDDATLVTLAWPHTLCDAMGRSALINAWTLVLSGQEDRVPPCIGYDHDPLIEFGSFDQIESYKLVGRLLSPWQGIVFAVRYVFDLFYNKQEESRIVCIPASKIQALKSHVMQQVTAESPDAYVSEGDVLCAYWSRYALSHIDPDSTRTVSLINPFGLRAILSKDILPAPGSYIGNAILSVCAFFSVKEIYNSPLYQLAWKIRRSMIELGTREQLEAASATSRKAYLATGYTPVFGDATMSLLAYTNWTKAKFFDIDFSSAVVKEGADSKHRFNKIGRPSHLQPHTYVKKFSIRDAVGILGKDAQGNYWLAATMRKGIWAIVEKDLAANKYDI